MKNFQQGFALVSLISVLLAVAIIAFLMLFYLRSPGQQLSPAQTGQKAIEDAKTSTDLLQQQQEEIELQNEINSMSY